MDVDKLLSETDKFLLDRMVAQNGVSSHTHQAMAILQQRMIDRLIESLNKNSESADKLASRLNTLTLVIGVATLIGAAAAILQTIK